MRLCSGGRAAAPSRGEARRSTALHALHQKPLRERLLDEVVGADLEPEELVDLLVSGGEEDDRQVGRLPELPQELHPVHARHLDVEDREVGRIRGKPVERGASVVVGRDAVALRFQNNGDRGQDVAVIVDESNRLHQGSFLRRARQALASLFQPKPNRNVALLVLTVR